MPMERFWQLSLLEITDFMDSKVRSMKREQKQKLTDLHFLTQDIGQYTALALHGSDNVRIMELWDFFPQLFAEEKEESKRVQASQMAVYQAQMLDYALRHNHKRKGGDG